MPSTSLKAHIKDSIYKSDKSFNALSAFINSSKYSSGTLFIGTTRCMSIITILSSSE